MEIGEPSSEFFIRRGVRQGCILSPKLFNLYTDPIFRETEDSSGVNIGGANITNIRYADDTVLLAESENALQILIDIVRDESLTRGLRMNLTKTKVMVISRQSTPPKAAIKVNDTTLKQVSTFKYLGHTVTDNGKCDTEVRKRIEIARQKFLNIKGIQTTQNLTINTRKRLIKCYITSTLLYASETWTFNKELLNKISSFEMWMYRKMLKISYTDHVTNEEVLRRVGEKPSLTKNIVKRKLQYFGHIIRQDSLQKFLIEGKVDRKRGRGRPRRTWLSDVTGWTGYNLVQCVREAVNRKCWRDITASAPLVAATRR